MIAATLCSLLLETIAAADLPSEIPVWATLASEHRVSAVALSADATHLVAAGPHGVISWWNVGTAERAKYLKGSSDDSTGAAVSPDRQRVAVSGIEGEVRLFDVAQGKVIRSLGNHGSRVSQVSFSPDGKVLASTCWDGRVRLWTVADGTPLGEADASPIGMSSIFFASDGASLLIPARFDSFPGTPESSLAAPLVNLNVRDATVAIKYDANGTFWVSADARPQSDWIAAGTDRGEVVIWSPDAPAEPKHRFRVLPAEAPTIGAGVVSLDWISPNRLFVMTMQGRGGVFARTGEKIASFDRPTEGFVAADVAASHAAVAGWNKTIEIIDLTPWSKEKGSK